jgi:hypothetical protein
LLLGDSGSGTGLPEFSWRNAPNMGKIYQNTTKYLQWSHNIPKAHKIPIPNGHNIYQNVQWQGVQKYVYIGIFGMKLCHLATLEWKQEKSNKMYKTTFICVSTLPPLRRHSFSN